MARYELFYFKSMGRAEPARLIFAQAGVQFTDTRFKDRDDWLNNYKKNSPFGVAPYLEVDGQQIGGGREIARFLGEQFGLAGSNSIQNAQLGSISDHIDDMLFAYAKYFEAKEEEDKERLKKEFIEKSPKWLAILEDKVTASGWLYGDKITWVDMYFYHYVALIQTLGSPDFIKDYPKLTALMSTVQTQPNIAKWLEERPKTEN